MRRQVLILVSFLSLSTVVSVGEEPRIPIRFSERLIADAEVDPFTSQLSAILEYVEQLGELEKEFADLEEIWKAEKASLQGAAQIKSELEQVKLELEAARRAGDLTLMSELQYGRMPELEKQLELAQEAETVERTLLRNKVTDEEIAEVVSRWTGIPVTKMLEGEKEKLIGMETRLKLRIIGQDEAVSAVSNAVAGPGRTDSKGTLNTTLMASRGDE